MSLKFDSICEVKWLELVKPIVTSVMFKSLKLSDVLLHLSDIFKTHHTRYTSLGKTRERTRSYFKAYLLKGFSTIELNLP